MAPFVQSRLTLVSPRVPATDVGFAGVVAGVNEADAVDAALLPELFRALTVTV